MLETFATSGESPIPSRIGKLTRDPAPQRGEHDAGAEPGGRGRRGPRGRSTGMRSVGISVKGGRYVACAPNGWQSWPLIALFVIGTVLPINMGALGFVAAWLVGMYALDLDEKEIIAGISGDLVLTLIGRHLPVRDREEQRHGRPDSPGRRAGGARSGGADPVGDVRGDRRSSPRSARRARPPAPSSARSRSGSPADTGSTRCMMAMLVVHGAQAGGFSPISIYGTITNTVMRENDLPVNEARPVPDQPGGEPGDRDRPVRRHWVGATC